MNTNKIECVINQNELYSVEEEYWEGICVRLTLKPGGSSGKQMRKRIRNGRRTIGMLKTV